VIVTRTYDDAIQYFEPGDLLLCMGCNIWSRGIRIASLSPYSHAGMLVDRVDCGWAVLDVLQWRGGSSRPLLKAIQKNPGNWHHYKANPGNRYEWNRAAAVARMWQFDDCEYGWWELGKASFMFLPGLRLLQKVEKFCVDGRDTVRNGDPKEQAIPPFCSMAYDIACEAGGIDPVRNLRPSQTTPGDLSRSLFFEPVSALVPDRSWLKIA
jgi:hypothetical protein